MIEVDRNKSWSDFLAAWPPERVRQMSLEEYTNPNKDDAFIYWLEFPLDPLGSISGGSAFKFGVYYQSDPKVKDPSGGRCWGERYAWLEKYGTSPETAFATIRARLIEVLDAAQVGNLARVDDIDLPSMLKWKVAFLYQDRKSPVLFPIFKKEALFFHYRTIVPNAKIGNTPYHVMYETLLARHRSVGDVFTIASELWSEFKAKQARAPRAWVMPLAWAVDATAIEALVSRDRVEPEDIDPYLENLLADAELAEGDYLALLLDGDIRAVGKITGAEPGEHSWNQTPVNFPSGLLVNPTSAVRELDDSERQEIWSHVPGEEAVLSTASGPRYWKIAPGSSGVAWPEWRDRGVAAIGWAELGDLSRCSETDFRKLAEDKYDKPGRREGPYQVWTFRGIRPGDRIIANQGTHSILGVGTVTEGYRFVPSAAGGDFPHQIKVHWDDTTPRSVQQSGWRRTLLELTKEDFDRLTGGADAQASFPTVESPAPYRDPSNIILYGPPGTGKTYSTVRRALQLILEPDSLAGLDDKASMALFREHQARGQIEFVTFHQAYGYEEFVEGIRPVLDGSDKSGVRYELHNGVFKRIALRAAAEGLRPDNTPPDFDDLWTALLQELEQEDGRIAKSQSGKTYLLEISARGNILVRSCEVDADGNVTDVADPNMTASRENARLYWRHRAELGPEPEKLTYKKTTDLFAREKGSSGGNHYTALWLVYSQLYALNKTFALRKPNPVELAIRAQQAIEKPGPTTTFSFSARTPQYVLIIDEINRGNISKILGELITLLEPDKRLAARNELKLPLSYSPQQRFAVPPNLHILGTMNTADRSIALMDVALRRRFTFEELMPDAVVLRNVLTERTRSKPFVDLVVELFDTLNYRIRFLYDRDHQLGHSYFLEATAPKELRRVFIDRIIPMLQEYFYGAWDKICIVLGCPYTEAGRPKRGGSHLVHSSAPASYVAPLITATVFQEVKSLGLEHDDYEDRIDYRVRGELLRDELAEPDLLRSFLNVLNLESEPQEQRLNELLAAGQAEPAQPA